MNVKQYKQLTQQSEHSIQNEVIGYLRMKGYYVQRMNSGKYSVGEGANRRFIQGAEAGTPDVMAFRLNTFYKAEIVSPVTLKPKPGERILVGDVIRHQKPDLLFVEIKRPKNKPTPLQTAKMKELEEYGARCLVVHSVEELENQL